MITTRRFMIALAVLAACAIGFNSLAVAEDEAPTAAPKVEKKMPAAGEKTDKAEAPKTKTPTPMHTMMYWLVSEVMETPSCPTTEAGGKAWRAWYANKEAKHAGLRDMLVEHGWTADSTIAFFKKMKSECNGCDKACNCGAGDCDSCKKGAAGAAGDASEAGDAKSKCGSCDDCQGCDKAKAKDKGAAGAAGDASETGDAKGCDGCGGGCKGKKSDK